jgi:hypothetical protein
VSTDPYVAPDLDDLPRQEQNVAPGVRIPPAEAWTLHRPGDEVATGQPRGFLFGSPGPNVGYALSLVQRARDRMALAPHEHGRAPVMHDIECAMLVLGYQGGCAPDFAEWRERVVDGAHHEYPRRRALCDAVPLDALRLAPQVLGGRVEEVRRQVRAAAEGRPIDD